MYLATYIYIRYDQQMYSVPTLAMSVNPPLPKSLPLPCRSLYSRVMYIHVGISSYITYCGF